MVTDFDVRISEFELGLLDFWEQLEAIIFYSHGQIAPATLRPNAPPYWTKVQYTAVRHSDKKH